MCVCVCVCFTKFLLFSCSIFSFSQKLVCCFKCHAIRKHKHVASAILTAGHVTTTPVYNQPTWARMSGMTHLSLVFCLFIFQTKYLATVEEKTRPRNYTKREVSAHLSAIISFLLLSSNGSNEVVTVHAQKQTFRIKYDMGKAN